MKKVPFSEEKKESRPDQPEENAMSKRKEIEGEQAGEPKKARQDIPLEDEESSRESIERSL